MTKNMRSLVWLGLAGITGVSSCAEERPPISHVETGVVDKRIFDGSWYMATTVIDVDYEGAQLSFEGDSAYDYSGGFFTLPHVRWVIQEDYLLAYRDYELIQNTDTYAHPDVPAEDFQGDPVAAFPITSHFDIRREYNPTTGEESNILVENDTDRRWWERDFMRVDWSRNDADSFQLLTADLYEQFGLYTRENVSFQIQEGDDFPDDWKPTFRAMTCDGWDDTDCDPQDRDHAGDYEKGDIYYMSFVTQALLTPGIVPDPFGRGMVPWCTSIYSDAPICTTNLITMRHSFLKRSPLRQYEPLDYPDVSRFDRFGLFRLDQSVYDRSVGAWSDPTRGQTDAKNYAAVHHNIWKQWWNVNADGTKGDPIPYTDREVRPIIYYMTKDMPYHLMRASFEVASDWNVNYMNTVRALRGEEFVDKEAIGSATPDDPSDDFSPYQPAGSERNPFDCWIHTPDGQPGDSAEPTFAANQAEEEANGATLDTDFSRWAQVVMDGPECVLVSRVNSCIASPDDPSTSADESLPCEERGDLRYHYISYVSQPGTPFLGVATLRGDAVTGEYMAGDANIGGPALDSYRTRTLLYLDVAAGRISPDTIVSGNDLRDYFERLGTVDAPAIPLRDFNMGISTNIPGFDPDTIRDKFANAVQRAEELHLHGDDASILFDERLQRIQGTDIEHQLFDNDELFAAAGLDVPVGAEPSEALLDQLSFSRRSAPDMMSEMDERQRFYDERTMEFAGEGFDHTILRYAMDNKDLPRSQLVYQVNRLLYKGTQSHELGHCMGQRHNFGASTDVANYGSRYFDVEEAHPWPNVDDFDTNGNGTLDADEEFDYRDAWAAVKRDRDLDFVLPTMSTSTMDYSWHPLADADAMGRYDAATIYFAYGDFAEVHDNPDHLAADNRDLLRGARSLYRYYSGGEPCAADADCPSVDDPLLVDGQPTQRCVMREDTTPLDVSPGVCSNFYDDMRAQATADDSHLPVEYKFCTDDRVGSIGWCHRFDQGASFQEIVANMREAYHRDYIFSNFRRFRSGFGPVVTWNRLVGRLYRVIVDIFQNMFYRYAFEGDAYRTDPGAFGFYDQYMASAQALNFFMEVVGQPEPGGFTYNRIINEFTRTEVYPDVLTQDLNIYLGQGKYMRSVYQAGLTGLRRLERIGVFYDKVWAMQMLFVRNWGWRYSRDQRWMVNYYDLFPDEVLQLVSGATRDYTQDYSARVMCETFDDELGQCGNPRITYMNFYRGDCRLTPDEGVDPAACRPSARETYAGIPTLDSGSAFLLQLYAPYFSLAYIPTWYDTTFQQRFNICELGQGDCSPPGEVDGVPEVACDPATECDDADYVTFTSDRYHATWLARKVERGVNDIEGASVSFDMVKETAYLQDLYKSLREAQEAGTYVAPYESAGEMAQDMVRIRDRRDNLENFMMFIRNLQQQMGIWLYI